MSTVVNFKGKRVVEPGVYAQIKSGIPAKPSNFSFGNLTIIDTGKGKTWGGGSGIAGRFSNGINSVYSFNDVDDFKSFVKGGLFYDLADYIFNPLNGASGPETVQFVRACTTTPAEINYSFTSSENGGVLKFLCKNEGEVGNGFTDETLATATIRVGTLGNDPLTIGDVLILKAGVTTIGSFTTTSNSMSEALSGLNDSVNSGTLGYTSKIQGTSLIIYSRPNTVVAPNTMIGLETNGEISWYGLFVGYAAGTMLSQGYAAQMRPSDSDPQKYVVSFYEGTFAGYTEDGNSINGLTKQQSPAALITESVEFSNIDDLIQWAKNDFIFNKLFELDEDYLQIGDGSIVFNDFLANDSLNLATNGTSVYNASDLDTLLVDVRELQNTFFLSDRFGDEARGVENMKILNAIKNNSEFDRFLIIGGGKDETKFDTGNDSSIEIAKFYDSTSVIVVHSGETRYDQFTNRKEKLPSIYHAANFAGRLGGLEPQVPATFKALKIKEFNHPLGLKQREKALKYGVIHNRTVPGIGNVTNQAINTLQNNSKLVNQDGTSHEISIMRIGAQLNKELILNMRPLFVGNNWGQASPADVKTYIEGYLLGKTVTSNQDNLILSSKNVTVRLVEDYYEIKYGFIPNGPINKLFITGFMLDANLSA